VGPFSQERGFLVIYQSLKVEGSLTEEEVTILPLLLLLGEDLPVHDLKSQQEEEEGEDHLQPQPQVEEEEAYSNPQEQEEENLATVFTPTCPAVTHLTK
tara:strand:- start:224 stop:520 length:297 start_codon:yes stop_codon:yes gene_type:complete